MTELTVFTRRWGRFVPGTAVLERLYTGTRWGEGPVYFADCDALIWSDIPNNRMLRWAEGQGVGVFRCPSNYANGNTRDRCGRLLSCEHGTRSITRTEHDGTISVLVDRYRGKRLNSPNDVVVKSDGTVWFTDPPYGILSDYEGYKAEPELDGNYVFRFDPQREQLSVVADDFVMPNGLAFAPDESCLYVSDTGISENPDGPAHIRRFQVVEGKGLRGGEVFADLQEYPASDGFRLDTEGNLWTSARDGVNCYTPRGELVVRIQLPELVSNLTFGGPRRNRLLITAQSSLYAIYVDKNGAQRP